MTKFFNLYFKKLSMNRTTDKLNFSLIGFNKVTLICTQKNTKLLLHRPIDVGEGQISIKERLLYCLV